MIEHARYHTDKSVHNSVDNIILINQYIPKLFDTSYSMYGTRVKKGGGVRHFVVLAAGQCSKSL